MFSSANEPEFTWKSPNMNQFQSPFPFMSAKSPNLLETPGYLKLGGGQSPYPFSPCLPFNAIGSEVMQAKMDKETP